MQTATTVYVGLNFSPTQISVSSRNFRHGVSIKTVRARVSLCVIMHANSRFLLVDSDLSGKSAIAKVENFELSQANFFHSRYWPITIENYFVRSYKVLEWKTSLRGVVVLAEQVLNHKILDWNDYKQQ